MTNIEKYKNFCENNKSVPLYNKAWWLDAVCDKGEWDVALVERNDEIVASMPYCIKKKSIFRAITLPKLTQTMGVYILYPKDQKYSKKLSWEKKMMDELIEQIPKVDTFTQSFNYQVTNLLPFFWKGYSLSMGYTYVIEDLSDIEEVYNQFSSSTKKEIKHAKKQNIQIVDSDDIETFYKINTITYQKQKKTIPYSFDFIQNLYKKAKEQNAVVMKFAMKDDEIYSVRLCFYDESSLYTVVGSSNRNIRLHGSEHLLDWEVMKSASERGLSFNFNGSMLERIESRMRSFGTVQKTYPIITKTNSTLLKTIKLLQETVH